MGDDSDYERYHRKKKKRNDKKSESEGSDSDHIPIKIKPKETQKTKRKKYSISDSESDDQHDHDVPIKIKAKKVTTKHKESKAKTPKKKEINRVSAKKKKKQRKVQSEKVSLNSLSKQKDKASTKSAKKPKKTKDKTVKRKKSNKSKVTTPKAKKIEIKKRNKRKTKKVKSATLVDSELSYNTKALFDDDKKLDIGNDTDLSVFALDSKKRDQIKANKNATFGGFKLKINYRYRLDDNRIALCRFIGIPLFAKTSEEWIGMVIEHNGEGEHDGTVQNKSYFRCRDGKGVFVRPFRIIEDLGINTKQLTKEQIKGSPEILQIIKDIKNGKTPKPKNKKKSEVKRKKSVKTVALRDNKKKQKRRNLKKRSKTVTNLDDKGKWKPPEWMNDIDQDHGYDFLASKPFYSKEHLEKYKYVNKPVSVTSTTAKNNY